MTEENAPVTLCSRNIKEFLSEHRPGNKRYSSLSPEDYEKLVSEALSSKWKACRTQTLVNRMPGTEARDLAYAIPLLSQLKPSDLEFLPQVKKGFFIWPKDQDFEYRTLTLKEKLQQLRWIKESRASHMISLPQDLLTFDFWPPIEQIWTIEVRSTEDGTQAVYHPQILIGEGWGLMQEDATFSVEMQEMLRTHLHSPDKQVYLPEDTIVLETPVVFERTELAGGQIFRARRFEPGTQFVATKRELGKSLFLPDHPINTIGDLMDGME